MSVCRLSLSVSFYLYSFDLFFQFAIYNKICIKKVRDATASTVLPQVYVHLDINVATTAAATPATAAAAATAADAAASAGNPTPSSSSYHVRMQSLASQLAAG